MGSVQIVGGGEPVVRHNRSFFFFFLWLRVIIRDTDTPWITFRVLEFYSGCSYFITQTVRPKGTYPLLEKFIPLKEHEEIRVNDSKALFEENWV